MQLIFGKIIIIIIILLLLLLLLFYYYYYYYYHYKLKVENEIEKAHFKTSLLIFCWLIRWLVW